MVTPEVVECSFFVNRRVRTRMPGGVGLGVKYPRLPDYAKAEPNLKSYFVEPVFWLRS